MIKSKKASPEAEVLRDLLRVLHTVRAATAALVHTGEERQLLKEFCRIIVEQGKYPFAWVGYAEPRRAKRLLPVASWGERNDFLKLLTFTWDESELGSFPAGVAMRTGELCMCRDVRTDAGFAPWRDAVLARGFTSCLALPLTTPEQPLGAISIFAEDSGAFQSGDVEVLSMLAETLAYGVMALRTRERNRQFEEELSRQARGMETIDTLVSDIAQDLSNILGVMSGYAEMALYRLPDDRDLIRKLRKILKAGQCGKDLVNKILAFSPPDNPETNLRKRAPKD